VSDPTTTHLGGLVPRAFDAGGASFFQVLQHAAPDAVPDLLRGGEMPEELRSSLIEGTTVLALVHAGGVVVAGDRRATSGNIISRKDMRKVFPADDFSAIAISGAAGPAMDLARLFSTELEHYEKIEGEVLSLDGKSNKLAGMVRANLPLAMQGLVVVPLFAGVDPYSGVGSIFEYDPVGGRYRSTDYAATGSGSMIAKGTLKRLADPTLDAETAIAVAVEALFDAAEDDSATGGPDLVRRIYPIVAVIDTDGYRELDEDAVAAHVEAVVASRRETRGL
jgi:proteasome beta subunit